MKKRLISSAVAIAALGAAGAALANEVTPFDLTVPYSFVSGDGVPTTYSNIDEIDWSASGNGIAIGVGPFTDDPIPIGTTFKFLYQSQAEGFEGITVPLLMDTEADGDWNIAEGIQKKWELTVAVTLWETVTASEVTDDGTTATFRPAAGYDSYVSIYFDAYDLTAEDGAGAGVAANASTGQGFDGGIEIARFTITEGIPGFETVTTFLANSPTQGEGSPNVYAELDALLAAVPDFVNGQFLVGVLGSIFDWEWQGTINYPPTAASLTTGMHIGGDETRFPGVAFDDCSEGQPCDIQFKVDGNSVFTYQVPEPGTMLLLGGGLLGLGFGARRRKA